MIPTTRLAGPLPEGPTLTADARPTEPADPTSGTADPGERGAAPRARSVALRSVTARLASFVPTALATLLASRLILAEQGTATFSAYALLITVIALLPLNTLGVGASVTAAFATRGAGHATTRQVLLTATRVMALSTLATVLGSGLLTVLGAWPVLLSVDPDLNAWVGLSVAIWALGFVPGLAASVLLGLHRNELAIALQALLAPLSLALVGVLVLLDAASATVLLVPSTAQLAVNLLTARVAGRRAALSWLRLCRDTVRPRRVPGTSIGALSAPMLVITLLTPVLIQSHRLVLSHVSGEDAVIAYTVVMQVFAPALALVVAASEPLWPIYARARLDDRRGQPFAPVLAAFVAGSAVFCGVLALLARPVADAVAGDTVTISWTLIGCAAGYALAYAVAAPLRAFLFDPPGLRFLAVLTTIAVPCTVAVALAWTPALGAAGPLAATIAVTVVVQIVPAALFAVRRRRGAAVDALTGTVLGAPLPK